MILVYVTIKALLKIIVSIFLPGTWIIQGRYKVLPNKTYIAIARHRSRWDIPLVAIALPRTKNLFVAREGLALLCPVEKWPWLRKAFEGRYITFINRENPSPAQWKAIEKAAQQKLHNVIIIFPEGTTAVSRKPHSGFIRLARKYNLAFLPINIMPWGRYGKENNETLWAILSGQGRHTSLRIGDSFSYSDLLKELESKLSKGAITKLNRKELERQLSELAMELVDQA